MTDFDRYDFAMSMVIGLIMVGTLMLGAPFWTVFVFLTVGVTITVYRHFVELPPHRSRR
jgi:hypothetical protein